MAALDSTLGQEINTIVLNHLDELKPYMSTAVQEKEMTLKKMVLGLERLSEICQCSPYAACAEVYFEAYDYYQNLQSFLRKMNKVVDKETRIGQIWMQARNWFLTAAEQFQPSASEVWDLILPVTPDRLIDLGNGEYEARWWKPVPLMDVELLTTMEGLLIHGEPFEPHNLKGGLACRFSLTINTEEVETVEPDFHLET